MLSWFVKVRLWVGVLRDLDRFFRLRISIWNIGKESWRAFLLDDGWRHEWGIDEAKNKMGRMIVRTLSILMLFSLIWRGMGWEGGGYLYFGLLLLFIFIPTTHTNTSSLILLTFSTSIWPFSVITSFVLKSVSSPSLHDLDLRLSFKLWPCQRRLRDIIFTHTTITLHAYLLTTRFFSSTLYQHLSTPHFLFSPSQYCKNIVVVWCSQVLPLARQSIPFWTRNEDLVSSI